MQILADLHDIACGIEQTLFLFVLQRAGFRRDITGKIQIELIDIGAGATDFASTVIAFGD